MRHGIDVSVHNGTIDWAKVKASNRVNFAILRAGFGKVASQKDKKFDRNYQGCVDNNIPVGVYWYSYAKTVADAKLEAQVCLQVLGGRKLQFPVYFDFEERSQLNTGRANVSAMADAFCQTIQAGGYTPGLYSMKSGLTDYLTADMKKKYTVWVAQINCKQTSYAGPFDMWQYSWKGRINGIVGDVDMSYCYNDAFGGTTSTPNAPTTPTTSNTPTKPITEIAQEVLDGKWGNGADRKTRLAAAGYNYAAVQEEVNRLLKANAAATAQANAAKTYTVKRGDTLSAIAKKHNTTVKKIVNDNKSKYPQITPNFIKVGWVLKV